MCMGPATQPSTGVCIRPRQFSRPGPSNYRSDCLGWALVGRARASEVLTLHTSLGCASSVETRLLCRTRQSQGRAVTAFFIVIARLRLLTQVIAVSVQRRVRAMEERVFGSTWLTLACGGILLLMARIAFTQ